MSTRIVAIAGASGFAGEAFTDALLRAEAFEVRVLSRKSSVSALALIFNGILILY